MLPDVIRLPGCQGAEINDLGKRILRSEDYFRQCAIIEPQKLRVWPLQGVEHVETVNVDGVAGHADLSNEVHKKARVVLERSGPSERVAGDAFLVSTNRKLKSSDFTRNGDSGKAKRAYDCRMRPAVSLIPSLLGDRSISWIVLAFKIRLGAQELLSWALEISARIHP